MYTSFQTHKHTPTCWSILNIYKRSKSLKGCVNRNKGYAHIKTHPHTYIHANIYTLKKSKKSTLENMSVCMPEPMKCVQPTNQQNAHYTLRKRSAFIMRLTKIIIFIFYLF